MWGDTQSRVSVRTSIIVIYCKGGRVYIVKWARPFGVRDGCVSLTISSPITILQGAGGMGSNGAGVSASMVLGSGSGSTFTIQGMGCVVRDLVFMAGVLRTAPFCTSRRPERPEAKSGWITFRCIRRISESHSLNQQTELATTGLNEYSSEEHFGACFCLP